jgi:azurin
MNNILAIIFFGLLSIGLIGCGGSDSEETSSTANANDSDVVSITVESGDDMRYNTDRIEVEAGQTVELTLVHTGEMSIQAMGHNLVILKADTDTEAFATAAMNAAANDYIPSDMEDGIVAYTDLIGGGEQTTIEFEAPEPGTYTFICSFPGHAGIMRGEFVVN